MNNLASKLLLSLLPPNAPFFRLAIDNFAVKEIEENDNLKTQIDSGYMAKVNVAMKQFCRGLAPFPSPFPLLEAL